LQGGGHSNQLMLQKFYSTSLLVKNGATTIINMDKLRAALSRTLVLHTASTSYGHAECNCAGIIMLNAIMLNAIMLSVIMLHVTMLHFTKLHVTMLNVTMLNVIW
jgi:hypothetical protein